MVKKSPTQFIYDETFKEAQKICEKVYDVLPMEDVGYPFINLGEVAMKTDNTKDSLINTITLDVHIWGNRSQRKLVDDYGVQLLNALIPHGLQTQSTKNRIMIDDTTDEILFRNFMELTFEYRGVM